MDSAEFADVNRMLALVESRIRDILGSRLLALYLTGSLVTGDFDHDVSDIDLLAVTAKPLDPHQLESLDEMHRDIAVNDSRWDNRIEVAYVSVEALKSFRASSTAIGIISPGEPFRTKDAGIEWLINWYVVLRFGRALYGPAPTTFIDPISTHEFLEAARHRSRAWRESIGSIRSRNAQVYVILSICRALYAIRRGEYGSKRQAALWAADLLPQWSSVIRAALASWRDDWYNENVDHLATDAETSAFILYVADLIESRTIETTP